MLGARSERNQLLLRAIAEHDHSEQARYMKALAGLGRTLSETLDLRVVGERTTEALRSSLSLNLAVLYRLDPETGDLTAVAMSMGETGAFAGRVDDVPAGTGVIGRAVADRQSDSTADLLHDSRIRLTPRQRERLAASDNRAVLAVPLIVQGRVIGALSLGDRVGRVFGADDARLARAFADQAALAVENAWLYEEAQQRLRRTETLLTVGRTVGGTLDLVEATRRVAREIARVFGAERALSRAPITRGGQLMYTTIIFRRLASRRFPRCS